MEHITNQAILRGSLAAEPVFSHENHGTGFFRFYLDVPRLSGVVDTLPVIAPEGLLQSLQLQIGTMLTVTGQVRSYNQRSEQGRHLLIFLFAASVTQEDGEPVNQVLLRGPICREPTYRRTPLGRQICDVMLAVPRSFRRSDYLPCILWGRTAQLAAQCGIRDVLHISGRLQSRQYTKLTVDGALQKTAYEVSALSAEVLPPEEPPAI